MSKPLEKFTRLSTTETTVEDMIQKLNYIFANLSTGTDSVVIGDNAVGSANLDLGYDSSQVNAGVIPIIDTDGNFSSTYIEGALEELADGTMVIHQPIEVAGHSLGANRPTEASVGTIFGWQVAKTKEFYLSDRLSTMATGNGESGASTFEFHMHLVCNNTSASKQVKFTLAYLCSDDEGTVLGGAGTPVETTVDVPTTAYENFKVTFAIPKAAFVDKPYLTAKITRDAIVDNPDPDDDPIVYKCCLVYDAYIF